MAASDTEPAWKPKPYTQEQADQINTLMAERHITTKMLLGVFPKRPADYSDGVKVINWLFNVPLPTASPASSPQAGRFAGVAPLEKDGKAKRWRYALRNEAGEVKFYQVKRGRKPGMIFVEAQASDEFFPIRNRTHREGILAAIAKDPRAALALYGQEVGSCGRCGRTLTSEYRKLGIGPICIDK
jgi:hypothetical protein